MPKLTNKQSRFVEEYLVDLNAKQAAIRAGYSEKTAAEMGYENLIKPHVQEYIRERMDERSKRTEITADRILEAIAEIAYDTEEIKPSDRLRALELLGKHQALFTEKHVHEIKEAPRTTQEILTRLKELDEELAAVLH